MAPPASSTSLQDRILALVKTLQFVWFSGHVLTILGSFLYALTLILFRANRYYYKMAYFGALLSYGVVIYKSHGKPRPNAEYARKLVMDENAQYLLLAFFWFFTNPIAVTLIPFVTFSVFHALGYVRTNIIPNIFPRPTTTDASAPATWQAKTQQTIKSWTDKYYTVAMRFVAQSEVTMIALRLVLGLLRFNFLPFILYAQFLRFRYHLSTYTRQTFTELRIKFDKLLLPPSADPRIPAFVPNAYNVIKGLIIKFGYSIVQAQPAAPAQ
ncbi:uncharacterized protein BX663DRAFT_517094 [Cokeromyces recurvatus]|uniref:uncharacterized protein n=1 Tax=Cokeromyces recurvatus TaxID=90255 RepID=UPI00221FE233|nr:uncharacterized protein BX663DRAFT_517094 [Cokeromyces recurvatus]KAI7900636.1 hypothetical protein BX663DRAFT_517094 [Cokeromyces recurvatus]